ncbi:hypothetical protein BDK51DRAFT_34104 [Blyttiomyces helicus]|uniref:Uncharacterized protein n=1 Tax=Blyttiomyces helicus TaxID=388810 RepID=A0A4V1IQ55_9FUNG|nr:hypothetical protein BDK51DRAFT_34104 [Blyttiomyces helicus]|eukprot:RKO85377.1 hypothetical protein BDK51DRAFT_34104 [Blyttiomyces helicus]
MKCVSAILELVCSKTLLPLEKLKLAVPRPTRQPTKVLATWGSAKGIKEEYILGRRGQRYPRATKNEGENPCDVSPTFPSHLPGTSTTIYVQKALVGEARELIDLACTKLEEQYRPPNRINEGIFGRPSMAIVGPVSWRGAFQSWYLVIAHRPPSRLESSWRKEPTRAAGNAFSQTERWGKRALVFADVWDMWAESGRGSAGWGSTGTARGRRCRSRSRGFARCTVNWTREKKASMVLRKILLGPRELHRVDRRRTVLGSALRTGKGSQDERSPALLLLGTKGQAESTMRLCLFQWESGQPKARKARRKAATVLASLFIRTSYVPSAIAVNDRPGKNDLAICEQPVGTLQLSISCCSSCHRVCAVETVLPSVQLGLEHGLMRKILHSRRIRNGSKSWLQVAQPAVRAKMSVDGKDQGLDPTTEAGLWRLVGHVDIILLTAELGGELGGGEHRLPRSLSLPTYSALATGTITLIGKCPDVEDLAVSKLEGVFEMRSCQTTVHKYTIKFQTMGVDQWSDMGTFEYDAERRCWEMTEPAKQVPVLGCRLCEQKIVFQQRNPLHSLDPTIDFRGGFSMWTSDLGGALGGW